MTLQQAIEVLTELQQELSSEGECPDADAVQLGIEALKRVRGLRISGRDFHLETLSGETKEGSND